MAIVDWEGFDRETSPTLSGWNFSETTFTIGADAAGAFSYGRAGASGSTGGRYLPGGTTLQTGWYQMHFKPAAFNSTIINLLDTTTVQLSCTLNSDGTVSIKRGTTAVATSSLTIALGTFHFIQFRFSISSTVGFAELWINGVLFCSFTGNTQMSANSYINHWQLWPSNGFFDNILIYSEVGAAPNSRTPETRIFTDLPTGVGGVTGFTPSAGANWQCVDEQPNNSDTDYNLAAAAVLTDTFTCGSPVPLGSTIYGVAVELVARKDDAGTNDLDAVIESNGAQYAAGAPLALTTSYVRNRALWATDPDTSAAWSVTRANAARPGYRRTA